ncbi:hypothetical protein G6F50_015177 [Rhizopus delemar]|uniref:Uncharacterized protein n=1 Tax=Rhizopus delemar TaxID=936053 RepID=A0A9P6Y048_9FUNG|nr:hypothetical protein G6F50_015177 [Rhizopus delemar]
MEIDPEAGAAAGRFADTDRAAVVLHDLLHQMQAQPTATASRAQPVERLEDRLAIIDRNAGTLIADLQQAALIQAHADGAAPATVDDGVVHQP